MSARTDIAIDLVTRLQAVQEEQSRRDYDATIQEAIDALGTQATRIAELEGALQRLSRDANSLAYGWLELSEAMHRSGRVDVFTEWNADLPMRTMANNVCYSLDNARRVLGGQR